MVKVLLSAEKKITFGNGINPSNSVIAKIRVKTLFFKGFKALINSKRFSLKLN